MGGPQNWSGRGGEEKKSQLLLRLEPPIVQPVAQLYTTELFREYHIFPNMSTLFSPNISQKNNFLLNC
jgi:hypothetical protein